MSSQSHDKKLKNKSFLMKAYGRTDYKVAQSKGLDIVVAVACVLFAVIVWILH